MTTSNLTLGLAVALTLLLGTLRVFLIAIGDDGDEATTAAFTALVALTLGLLAGRHLGTGS